MSSYNCTFTVTWSTTNWILPTDLVYSTESAITTSGLLHEIPRYSHTLYSGLRKTGYRAELCTASVSRSILHNRQICSIESRAMPLCNDYREPLGFHLFSTVLGCHHPPIHPWFNSNILPRRGTETDGWTDSSASSQLYFTSLSSTF